MMRIAHICPCCLTELAYVRALVDSKLGLPLVRCPGCDRVYVRTRHPDAEFWRENRLLARAVVSLGVRLVLLAVAGGMLAISVLASAYSTAYGVWFKSVINGIPQPTVDELLGIVVLVLLAVLSGLLARSVISQRRVRGVLVILLIAMLAWVAWFELRSYLNTLDGARSVVHRQGPPFIVSFEEPGLLAVFSGTGLILAWAGVAVGTGLSGVARRFVSGRMRRALKKARVRRHRRRR